MPFDPRGLTGGRIIPLRPGTGAKLWFSADQARFGDLEWASDTEDLAIKASTDPRFVVRVNQLLREVRNAAVHGGDPAPALIQPANYDAARSLTDHFGPELAHAILVRAGLDEILARTVVSSCARDLLWGEPREVVRRRRDWPELDASKVARTPGGTELSDFLLGAVAAQQVRAIAEIHPMWVVLPSELVSRMSGVSVAFEDGLGETAGRLTRHRQLGHVQGEIVLNPEVGEHLERLLATLLAAFLLSKSRQAAYDEVEISQGDLVVDIDESTPGTDREIKLATLLAAADWLVISPERLVEELRRVNGGYEDRIALLSMDLSLPVDLLRRCAGRLHKLILNGQVRL